MPVSNFILNLLSFTIKKITKFNIGAKDVASLYNKKSRKKIIVSGRKDKGVEYEILSRFFVKSSLSKLNKPNAKFC